MANRWTKPAEAEKAPAAVAEAAPVAEPPAQPGLSGEGNRANPAKSSPTRGEARAR